MVFRKACSSLTEIRWKVTGAMVLCGYVCVVVASDGLGHDGQTRYTYTMFILECPWLDHMSVDMMDHHRYPYSDTASRFIEADQADTRKLAYHGRLKAEQYGRKARRIPKDCPRDEVLDSQALRVSST